VSLGIPPRSVACGRGALPASGLGHLKLVLRLRAADWRGHSHEEASMKNLSLKSAPWSWRCSAPASWRSCVEVLHPTAPAPAAVLPPIRAATVQSPAPGGGSVVMPDFPYHAGVRSSG
jgi:hypothetical protein